LVFLGANQAGTLEGTKASWATACPQGRIRRKAHLLDPKYTQTPIWSRGGRGLAETMRTNSRKSWSRVHLARIFDQQMVAPVGVNDGKWRRGGREEDSRHGQEQSSIKKISTSERITGGGADRLPGAALHQRAHDRAAAHPAAARRPRRPRRPRPPQAPAADGGAAGINTSTRAKRTPGAKSPANGAGTKTVIRAARTSERRKESMARRGGGRGQAARRSASFMSAASV
jgi:hypothetical protein